MISKFGTEIRKIRLKQGDSLRKMATKLGISSAFLSAMEVGRKTIPMDYVDKIASLYLLSDEEKDVLLDSINETNKRVSLELEQMNEAQKNISLVFARKINTADEELLEKLRKALLEDDN